MILNKNERQKGKAEKGEKVFEVLNEPFYSYICHHTFKTKLN